MTILYALLAALLAVPAVAIGCRGCVWALGKLKALQRRRPPTIGERPLPPRPGVDHPEADPDHLPPNAPRMTGETKR